MKCEYCDSYLATVPVDGVCPNCGGVVTEQNLPKPPFPLLKVPGGFLKMGQDAVRLYMRFARLYMRFAMPITRIVDITVPYDQIYDVSYIPATKWHKGILCVRSWQQRHIPLPRSFGEHRIGDSFIYFEMKDSSYAGHAYTFLKQWADKNREKEREL